MKGLVPQKDLPTKPKLPFLLWLIAGLSINSMLFLAILVDIVTWFYQEIYFTISKIPKIKRSEYVVLERYKLKDLTPLQRWSCLYCEYVNGVILWIKAVANQTEIYSCAIKYPHALPGMEYQKNFYEPEVFGK